MGLSLSQKKEVATSFEINWIYNMDCIAGMSHYPRNVLEFAGEHGFHPTQKPVALFEYLVRTYTDPGDVVVDCCMGSGTTAVACIKSGRRFVGFEMDEGYCEISEGRIQNAFKAVAAVCKAGVSDVDPKPVL